MNGKKLIAFALSLCLAGSITACGGSAGTEQKAAADGGNAKTQLNVATELTSATLDPADDWNSWFVMRWGALETLTRFEDDGTVSPWLAEDWSVADDQLTWTIKLKENVTFSNGEPMTATKVQESLERLFEVTDPSKGGNGNPWNYFTYDSISADDEAWTVTIVTSEPTVDLPGCLAYPWYGIIDVAGSADRDIAADGPICTGPYCFVSNDPEHDIQLVKNDNYWDGEVPFETVNVMKLGEASARAMALQDGSADMGINIAASDRAVLENAGTYQIDVTGGNRVCNWFINFDGVLGNDTLRKAVMTAIDGQTVCDVSTGGSYTYTNNTPVPGYDLDNPYSYDPEAAKAMLDEAGIVDGDGDGYRELDGKNIDINIVATTSRQQDVIAQAYGVQLEAIGIKSTISMPENVVDLRVSQGFDLMFNNEVTTPTGDPENFLKHWYGKITDTSFNYGNYHNEEYDALYEQLIGEFDTEKRTEIFTQMQEILMEDVATICSGAYNFNLCSAASVEGVHSYVCDYYWVTKDITPAS